MCTFVHVCVCLYASMLDQSLVDRVPAFCSEPVNFSANLPIVSRFFDGQMMTGRSVRLFVENESAN